MATRSPLRRWTLRIAAALLALAGLIFVLPACNTPFIPLPPPGDPTFAPVMVNDGSGSNRTLWETRGGPSSSMAEATVFILNADVGAGVIVRAQTDGSYVASPLDGREGDRIQIRYESKDGKQSEEICRVLRPGLSRSECQFK